MLNSSHVDVAARYLARKFAPRPKVAVVLGSGIPRPELYVEAEVPFAEVPNLASPTVEGHAGRFVFGRTGAGRDAVVVVDGRLHYFEGHDIDVVMLPVRACARLGCRAFIVTGAVGSLKDDFVPGDILALRDHINASGVSPLRAPSDEEFGPRFVAPADAYDADLRARARGAADELGFRLREGVYVWVAGPAYETAAEAAMLARFGGDVVGMSVVPEVLAARQMMLPVLGLAVVVNTAGHGGVNHGTVLEQSAAAGGRAAELISALLPAFARMEP